MKQLSIGIRLTLWYLAIFAVAEFCFGVSMWFVLRQHLYGIADKALVTQIEDATNLLKSQKPKNRSVAGLQEEVAEAYNVEHSGDFLQIYDQDGNWIFRAPNLAQNAFAPVLPAAIKNRSFRDVSFGGKPYRFITQRIDVIGRSFSVQTGVPIDQLIATLSLFERYLLLFAPLLLLAAASGGYWISSKALAPVDAITETARLISGRNLSARLEKLASGDELQRLSDTLNEMLARLEQAFLRVTQFTADASHELRTPISLIRAEAEIALRGPEKEEEYCDALRHILLEAERTSSLIEELLSLARADSGREKIRLSVIDLNVILTAVGKQWRPVIESRQLRFAQSTSGQEVPIMADCRSVERLVAILLDNAVKYTPPGGIVELHLERRLTDAVVIVRDNGIGIPEKEQARIFERFYRVDKSRSHEVGGAGLGLAIADWIVRQHAGSITVESSAGCGSTFTIQLPVAQLENQRSGMVDRNERFNAEVTT